MHAVGRERSMLAVQEEKEPCMQWRMRKKHACSEEWERSMHAVKEEKGACMQWRKRKSSIHAVKEDKGAYMQWRKRKKHTSSEGK
jgi:hypothetical protein